MSNITESDFKVAYKRFIDALRYIVQNELKLKQNEKRWAKIKDNFEQKFERPMDEAWQALSKEERKSLAPLYLHRRAQAEPVVKKVLEIFKGKIIKVEEE